MDTPPDAPLPVIKRRKRSSGLGMILMATFLPTVSTFAVWYFFLRDEPAPPPARPGPRAVTSPATERPSTDPNPGGNTIASTTPDTSPTSVFDPDSDNGGNSGGGNAGGSDDGDDSDGTFKFFGVKPEGGADSDDGSTGTPGSNVPPGTQTTTVRPQPGERQPVPQDEALESARETIRELFRDKLAAAKTPEAKHALARELYQQGMDTDDDPAARYSLLQQASDLAVEVGDFSSALRTIGDLSVEYEVDRISMALKVIQDASGNVRLPTEAAQLTEACMMLSEYAQEDSRFDAAALAVRIAVTNAARSKIPGLKLGVTQIKVQVARREAAWKLAEEARAQLEIAPDDSAAHEQLGMWLCFVQGDWRLGLQHLAFSDDALLHAAVVGEQNAPFSEKDRTALADAWQLAAESRDGLIQARFQLRARHWLNLVAQNTSGLTALQFQKQMDELDKQALGSERTWFSEMQPVASKLHFRWKLGIGYVGVDQAAIVVKGQLFPRGLGMHPPKKSDASMVQYALDGKFRTLVAPCAVTGVGPRGNVQFSVIGDNQLLWWSRRVNRGDIIQTCNVDVRGVRLLELRVSVQGDHWGAHACWLDPFLLKSEPPKGLELP